MLSTWLCMYIIKMLERKNLFEIVILTNHFSQLIQEFSPNRPAEVPPSEDQTVIRQTLKIRNAV
jgi:hypothetical protein